MIDIFVYPVSGVMKLWHLLLHNALGIEDSLSWFLSMLGLVVVIRSLLTPAFWVLYRSSRHHAIMRPQAARLKEEYEERTDPASVQEYAEKTKQLRKDNEVSTAAGCVPPLIQIPVFLGLYQVLLRMARPEGGLDAATHPSIGFITSEDVSAFLNSHIGGIPLSAYRMMDETTQLAPLGTTREAVGDFILPLLLLAVVFTTVNMIVSQVRNRRTMDYSSTMTRVMSRVIIVVMVFTPFLLLNIGWNGPIPVAIICYWFANNLWTLAQNVIMNAILNRTLPFTQEALDYSLHHKDKLKEDKERRKENLRAAATRAQRRELVGVEKQQKAEAKQRRKRLAAERAKSRKIIAARRAQLRREAKARGEGSAKSAAGDTGD